MGLLDIITGGGLGAVAGAVSGIAGKVIDLKMRKSELEQRAMDHSHELALRDKDREMAAQEAASQVQLHTVDADAQTMVADLGALSASHGSDRATYGEGRLGRIVDFVRGITRPLVTYAATVLVGWTAVVDPEFRGQALFMASMAISWWFAGRPGKLSDYKR